jgi:hypothetical protein
MGDDEGIAAVVAWTGQYQHARWPSRQKLARDLGRRKAGPPH